jgi:putative serine protease PepD
MEATDGRRRRRLWGAGAVLVMLVVAVAIVTRSRSSNTAAPVTAAPTAAGTSGGGPSDTVPGAAGALQDAFVRVLARVRPSVVEISTPQGLGSGVIYDGKGDIVTNAHVVGSSTSFQVTLADGRTLNGTLVGTYVPDDLAVIRVSDGSLPAATFADSSQVQAGDVVLAIGNPLGLASSVTDGIVSATGRTVSEGGGVVLPSTIQTSAPINPGNSGGGLVDLNGHVVGIPTLAAVDAQLGGGAAPGIGFAIPSNTVKLIADQLIASGRVTSSGRAALGISGTTVSTLGGQPVGVLVRSSAQAAKAAGIQAGDIVTAVNGKATPTLNDLQTVLAGLAPGQRVTVDVLHSDGRKQSYTLTLGSL